jgi:hypothetical protein
LDKHQPALGLHIGAGTDNDSVDPLHCSSARVVKRNNGLPLLIYVKMETRPDWLQLGIAA